MARSRILACCAAITLHACVTGRAAATPLHIGSRTQLFVGPWAADGRDAHLVTSMRGITMTENAAIVTGERLVVRDRPWEGSQFLDPYFCVIQDGEKFRMYYGAFPHYPKLWEAPNSRILCYAESTDGIHWTKPDLGLFEWNGSRKNNIVVPNDAFAYTMSEFAGACVFIDPNAAPDHRYKMILKMTPVRSDPPPPGPKLAKGQYLLSSADGIRWTLMRPQKVNPAASDTKFSILFDDALNQYVVYTRVKHQPTDSPKVQALRKYHKQQYGLDVFAQGRLVGRMTSPDLRSWGAEQAVLAIDEMDHAAIVQGYTAVDVEGATAGQSMRGGVDIYGSNITRYCEAPDIYIGLPTFYYHWKRMDMTLGGHEVTDETYPGTVDVQLVTSRDGVHFHRTPRRKPFIRLGPRGSWYGRMVWPSGNIIRVGDELWIYFSGSDVAHNAEQRLLASNGAHGRAVLRLDGFISADAAYTGGELITKPLLFEGNELRLNVDTSAGGSVRVELQDIGGRPIPGFTLADADEINGNHLRVAARWCGKPDVTTVAGTPVRLRIAMRAASLYAFQFVSTP